MPCMGVSASCTTPMRHAESIALATHLFEFRLVLGTRGFVFVQLVGGDTARDLWATGSQQITWDNIQDPECDC